MTNPDPTPRLRRLPFHVQDLQGLSRLGIDAVLGVTGVVEHLHQSIASAAAPFGATRRERTTGLTGLIYGAVRGSTKVVGLGLDGLTGLLGRLADPSADLPGTAPQREAVLAALNGVWGDHLRDSANPLATPMRLRMGGRALDLQRPLTDQIAAPGARVAVLVHGLCMNDLQWTRHGHDHGQLAQELGYTPVYLHYNSGLRISENGRAFSELLDQLATRWPVPLRDLVLIGHSMGGLVIRSACKVASAEQRPWLARLKKLVFLGSPHHGAPLERGGQLIDSLLGVSPYLAPFARLGRARSAGITDLRFGNLQDADWQDRTPQDEKRDLRTPVPLPTGVQSYVVAAIQSENIDARRNALLGDGLVPLDSALGRHPLAAFNLDLPEAHQLVLRRANHWDLLDRDEVGARLRTWLAD